jgi:hypothetical protein
MSALKLQNEICAPHWGKCRKCVGPKFQKFQVAQLENMKKKVLSPNLKIQDKGQIKIIWA